MRSIKLHIIRFTAISIGLLYVLHPLQNQIQSGLHAIAHTIDTSTSNAHHSHTHTANLHTHSIEGKHEHQLIAFFNDLFGTADKSSNDAFVLDITIDKHLLNPLHVALRNYSTPTILFFYKRPDKTLHGYLMALEKPPKSVLA